MTLDEGPLIVLAAADGEIENVCDECDKVLESGIRYLLVRHEGISYALTHNPSLRCCGKDVGSIRLFDTEEEAAGVFAEVAEIIRSDKGIHNLPLEELIIQETVN